MSVSFDDLVVGEKYTRSELADIWGYRGFQALARGVVTPRGANFIILFVTQDKQSAMEQYDDRLAGNILQWEGPTDHFAEDRILASSATSDEIHLFFRDRHHSPFVYHGKLNLESYERRQTKPSRFVFRLVDHNSR